MINDHILIERNWPEVASDLGLQLPRFTVAERPGAFVDWCQQVSIVSETRKRNLVGGFVERARREADRIAQGDAA